MKRGTRTFRWRFRRAELDAERQRLATALLNTSEELMKIHSDISKKTFDSMMGDPITQIEKIFKIGEQK